MAGATELIRGTVPHTVSTTNISHDGASELFERASWMETQSRRVLRGLSPDRRVGLLFYQNSTRTAISFQAATTAIGADYVGFTDVSKTRAGDFFQESLEDTIRVMGCYADVLVLRHSSDDAAQRAIEVAEVPVISAGIGESDHPTQGLLDVWMMHRLLGDLTGSTIAFVGDPRCRATRATLTLLLAFSPGSVCFLSPDGSALDNSQQEMLRDAGVPWEMLGTAGEVLRRADLVSMIPFQLPDFHLDFAPARDRPRLEERFVFSRELVDGIGRDVPIIHAGPRGDELPDESLALSSTHYFDGVRAGVFLRSALLEQTLAGQSPAIFSEKG